MQSGCFMLSCQRSRLLFISSHLVLKTAFGGGGLLGLFLEILLHCSGVGLPGHNRTTHCVSSCTVLA